MFRRSTVIVVGAGANAEYNMPLGSELRDEISVLLASGWDLYEGQGDAHPDAPKFWRALTRILPSQRDINDLIAAGKQLASVIRRYESVDEALHYFADNTRVIFIGKCAIAFLLIEHERRSSLYNPTNSPRSNDSPTGGWMDAVFQLAIAGLKRSQFDEELFDQIAFVDFNYDRCLEHYLYNQLLSHGLSRADCEAVLAKLVIFKPYGSLGALPWRRGAEKSVAFGRPDEATLSIAIQSIRTFTEGRNSDAVDTQVRRRMSASSTSIFLGFGFHQQNLQLLSCQTTDRHRVFGTAFKIDDANYSTLINAIEDALGMNRVPAHMASSTGKVAADRVILENRTAANLLSQLRPAISSAINS